jgi:hypothetical protein
MGTLLMFLPGLTRFYSLVEGPGCYTNKGRVQ